MLEMLKLVYAHAPEQSLHFLGDSAFMSSSMLKKMPEAIAVTGRIGCTQEFTRRLQSVSRANVAERACVASD